MTEPRTPEDQLVDPATTAKNVDAPSTADTQAETQAWPSLTTPSVLPSQR